MRDSWRRDVVAGLTVGVVALPLALAFGVTSGVGAASGVVTAVVAGVVASVFGGSNLQVSGPTGAMTVVLVPLVARHGAGSVYLVAVLAGLMVIVAAVARVGRLLAYMPWPVVEGFTVGIAAIIVLQQVPASLGVPKAGGENAAAVAVRTLARAPGAVSAAAVGLTVLTAASIVVLTKLHRGLPAGLLAVVGATVVAEVARLDVGRIGSLPRSLPAPQIPSLAGLAELLPAAFAVAALVAIESLLSAKVADGMADVDPHDPDRELFGQGLANVASGLFGGMPATGAIARTAVNARSGARTRLAAVIHSLTLLAVIGAGAGAVERVPLAALAGVLVVTAARMIERHNVLAVVRSTRSDALVLGATAAATIAYDLVVAVEVGIMLAGFLALRQVALSSSAVAEAPSEMVSADTEQRLLDEHILTYRIDGAFFFGAAQRFLAEMTGVSDIRVAILRLGQVQVLDSTGAQALAEIVRTLEDRGTTVLLKGLRDDHERILRAVGALDALANDRHVFDSLEQAVDHARQHVRREQHTAT